MTTTHCATCDLKSAVIGTRQHYQTGYLKRTRKCLSCNHIWHTYEVNEDLITITFPDDDETDYD